jgi:chromosome segregation ATPase
LKERDAAYDVLKAELEAQWEHTEKATTKIAALETRLTEVERERDAIIHELEELERKKVNLGVEFSESETRRIELEHEIEEVWNYKEELENDREQVCVFYTPYLIFLNSAPFQ